MSNRDIWTQDEELCLVAAVNKYKKHNWRSMIDDIDFNPVLSRHSVRALSSKWRHMIENKKVGRNGETFEYRVDILKIFEDTGLRKRLTNAQTGSERVEDVAELSKLAATKNIMPGNFVDLVLILQKLMKNINSDTELQAIKAIANFASDLKTDFRSYSKVLLPGLLQKLKQDNPTVRQALTTTLETLFVSGSLNLTCMESEVKEAVENDVGRVRLLTLNWLTFCVGKDDEVSTLEVYKTYIDMCKQIHNDEVGEVRDAAHLALKALKKGLASVAAKARDAAEKANTVVEEIEAALLKAKNAADEAWDHSTNALAMIEDLREIEEIEAPE